MDDSLGASDRSELDIDDSYDVFDEVDDDEDEDEEDEEEDDEDDFDDDLDDDFGGLMSDEEEDD